MNSLVAQPFPLAGAGQSEMLHSLVAVMLWAVLQAELTVSPVPLDEGVSPEPHQQFGRTQSCWVSEAVVLVLINFWKKQGKERKPLSSASHLSAGVQRGYHLCQVHLPRQSWTQEPWGMCCCLQRPPACGGSPKGCRELRVCLVLAGILQLSLLLRGVSDGSPLL